MLRTQDIQIRDPFVLVDRQAGVYHLFGTTGKSCRDPKVWGFDCYRSRDLENWEGPAPAFHPGKTFWASQDFWAPEVHAYRGRHYLFGSFKTKGSHRGTQVLVADNIDGPYEPLTDGPVTPGFWECLDGTLHIDQDGHPWIVFCHEWTQVHNGAVYAMRLSPDLREAAGRPVFLFCASEAPWSCSETGSEYGKPHRFPPYVTDGPFLHRLADGQLLMLWSSFGEQGYALGLARSQSGHITGPWGHDATPVWAKDGGHGMLFRTLDDRLMLSIHRPNRPSEERAMFLEIDEADDRLGFPSV